ncbi:hypothetical protein Peur_013865 [Populus x canadensis]
MTIQFRGVVSESLSYTSDSGFRHPLHDPNLAPCSTRLEILKPDFEGAGDCCARLDVELGVSDWFVSFSYFASGFPSNAVKMCVVFSSFLSVYVILSLDGIPWWLVF